MSDPVTPASNKADTGDKNAAKETTVKIQEAKPDTQEERKEKPQSQPCCGSCA